MFSCNYEQKYVNLIESGKSGDVGWGNQLGYIILPFQVEMHDDPLVYVRKAKKTLDRKKRSLEMVFTCKISELFLKLFGMKVYVCCLFVIMFFLGD
jgi:hypothetical protein